MNSETTESKIPVKRLVMPLSSEATMIGYLLEVGWKLHVSSNTVKGHAIFKQERQGEFTTVVKKCDVSVDAVLELQRSGKLKKVKQFTVNHETTAVYESA